MLTDPVSSVGCATEGAWLKATVQSERGFYRPTATGVVVNFIGKLNQYCDQFPVFE